MKTSSPIARILVVDDSKEICLLLLNHFKCRGFAVETAQSGMDAWKSIVKNHFDIVISDIIMPGMKGTDLLQKIKRNYPMTHVIMITGYVSLDHLLTCMRNGADTCIFKPMDNFCELDAAVEYALESKHSWEDKIIALKGLKDLSLHSIDIENVHHKDALSIETA